MFGVEGSGVQSTGANSHSVVGQMGYEGSTSGQKLNSILKLRRCRNISNLETRYHDCCSKLTETVA